MIPFHIIFLLFLASGCTVVRCNAEDTSDDATGVEDLKRFDPFDFVFPSFVCPSGFGRYAHEKDCGLYYECRSSYPFLMRCERGKMFDDKKRKCNDKKKVDCNRERKMTTVKEESKNFRCPRSWGSFAHPVECSKYYVCVYNFATLYTCSGSELFDERSSDCRDKRRVRCGNRLDREQMKTSKRPTTSTTARPSTSTTVPATPKETRRFGCPFPYGRFPDPTDCSRYYDCRGFYYTAYKCPRYSLYDERREDCSDRRRVKCGSRPGGDDKVDEKKTLRCPYMWGLFPHSDDCSKYIFCTYNVPTVYNCRRSELYHARFRRCYPKQYVTCDKRVNPDDPNDKRTTAKPRPPTYPVPSTTTPTAPKDATPTSDIKPSTDSTSLVDITPTGSTSPPEDLTPTDSTMQPIDYTPETESIPSNGSPASDSVPTTTITTNTASIPNTPPPTDCKTDDLDCIIEGTGDIKEWFQCPERYGYYQHGSSTRLFIRCDNWRPFVKKCASGTAFSLEYNVCAWVS